MNELAIAPDEELREGIEWYARFLEEDRGIPAHLSRSVAHFMYRAGILKAVQRPKVWVPEGSDMVRVYFDLWSQNSMLPIRWSDRTYFDAENIRVYAMVLGTRERHELSAKWRKSMYSGARTRAAIEELVEVTKCLREELESTS